MKERVTQRVSTSLTSLFLAVGISLFSLPGVNLALAAPSHVSTLRHDGFLSIYKQSAYFEIEQGSKLADQERYQQAIPHFQKAIEERPDSILAWYNLAYSQSAIAEGGNIDEAQFQKLMTDAEWSFQRSQNLNPQIAMTYYKLGKMAVQRQDFEAAKRYYRLGVINNPDNASMYFNLGVAYEKVEEYDNALMAYQRTIMLNPKFIYAYNNLGLLYEGFREYDKAEMVYQRSIQMAPTYLLPRLNLGNLLETQGRLSEAQAQYEAILAVEPDNLWAHMYLGNIYYKQSRYESALEAYERVISLQPDLALPYYLSSLTLQKLNRVDEAMARSLHYLQLDPKGRYTQEAQALLTNLKTAAHPQADADTK